VERQTARADAVLERVNIRQNPYLNALTDGSMTLECFRRTQEQFFFAVTFFPRPMAALVGRISDPRQRLDILHNLVEALRWVMGESSAKGLRGEQDAAAPGTRYIGENVPGAKTVVIPQAAHIANIEQAEAFNRALREFLSSPASGLA